MSTSAPPLVWDERFVTGVAEIDEQHLILVHTLNEAREKLAAEHSLEALQEITQNLLSYALYHFETEEELMQEYGYGEAEAAEAKAHLAQHRAFSARVVAIRDGLQSGTPIAPEELLGFLSGWLVDHILKTDKQLGAHVRARRAGPS